MNQVVCNYAPLRFLPYRDIGEFVNVGVVIHCPQTDFFGYRLVPLDRTARVTAFFPNLDVQLLASALQGITRELDRLQTVHRPWPLAEKVAPELVEDRLRWFLEVVRRREGLLHFGEGGTLLADTPQAALDLLFVRFVEKHLGQQQEPLDSAQLVHLAHI